MGSKSLIESFVVEAFHEDLGTIFSFPMLADAHSTFVKFLLRYAQHLGYLFCIMFLSLYILQHYIEFNTHTLVSLEKLLDVKSFGGSIGH